VTGQRSESNSDQHAERRTILPAWSAATSAVHIDGTEKGRERYRQRMSDGRHSTRQGTPQAALVVFAGRAVEPQWRLNRTRRLAEGVKARDAGATWASRPVVDGGEQRARSGARGCRRCTHTRSQSKQGIRERTKGLRSRRNEEWQAAGLTGAKEHSEGHLTHHDEDVHMKRENDRRNTAWK
jgi:hypothetical protein